MDRGEARWLLKGGISIGLAVGIALPFAMVTTARADAHCMLATEVQEVQGVSELPPELLELLTPIADVGTGRPFTGADPLGDPAARRLIRAGHRGTDWFVWYEHGVHSLQAVVADVSPRSEITVLVNAAIAPAVVVSSAGADLTYPDTLCSLTDGVLAGQVPPYPQGTWPATGY